MNDRISIGGIGLEALPNDQARFPMRVAALGRPSDVGRQAHIAGRLRVDVMERVVRKPHVLPTAGHGVGLGVRIVTGRTGLPHIANIPFCFERASRRRGARHLNLADADQRRNTPKGKGCRFHRRNMAENALPARRKVAFFGCYTRCRASECVTLLKNLGASHERVEIT